MTDPLTLPLNLPPHQPTVKMDGDGFSEIFDPVRNRWVAFTPEERVRQAFTAYLINHLHYPKGRLANEVTIDLNGQPVRCDTVVYDSCACPVAIIEYKAPNVAVSQKVLDQVLRYSIALGSRCVMISNGMRHYCAMITRSETPQCRFLDHIPSYDEITARITNP